MKENEQILSHKVFLRKRPLFQNELEKGEFDVVTCCGRQAVIHDARLHPDFLSMFIDNHSYNFHAVFDEETNNEQVYNEAVKPLFDGVLRGGSTATVRYCFPELSRRPVYEVLILTLNRFFRSCCMDRQDLARRTQSRHSTRG